MKNPLSLKDSYILIIKNFTMPLHICEKGRTDYTVNFVTKINASSEIAVWIYKVFSLLRTLLNTQK